MTMDDNQDLHLNSEISATQEISDAIKRLKNGKSPGRDNVLNEILKSGEEYLITPLKRLFNIVFASNHFPEEWSYGFIIPIFKKGDHSLAENYRGITLLSCLGKLFTQILNKRLEHYLEDKEILPRELCGFRSNHSTIDCILTLKSLVDKYVKSKRKKTKNYLFTCFVDFKKAFDSIPREKLFEKIRKIGISGSFYATLTSLYSHDKSAVKVDETVTKSFNCHTGVKQGCMLSPTLFNIFLHVDKVCHQAFS